MKRLPKHQKLRLLFDTAMKTNVDKLRIAGQV